MVQRVVTVNDVLDGHVALDIECLDRIYLNAYVPIKDVVGKVFALAWPFNRAHWVHTPDVFKDVPDPTS